MTWNESKGAADNQSLQSMKDPSLSAPYAQTRSPILSYAILSPPAQVYLPLARRPQ